MAYLNDKSAMIAQQAQIFDDLRSGSERCYLLSRVGKKFQIVFQLSTGWFVSWDKFREAFALRVATENTYFRNFLAQSSFVAYGIPDGDGDIDVYTIGEDKRDRVPPNETSPAWKQFVERDEKERFRIP